ncbi:hypothetical protein [Flavilitoribacter nigricans]|uniref:hypothetical protein n=1 Tax=Flavilitoribacter nigricans TaxID=70997 RepID=UPI00117A1DAA|nr:hypothetical protein [Flavilitoribacter nigricans]
MRKLSIYRLLAAYGLLVVLALPLGIQGVHPWIDEHQEQAHCDPDLGQVHIHDHSYAFDHCFVCTFHFSHYTEPSSSFISHHPGWILKDLMIEGHQMPVKASLSTRSSRAPPTA